MGICILLSVITVSTHIYNIMIPVLRPVKLGFALREHLSGNYTCAEESVQHGSRVHGVLCIANSTQRVQSLHRYRAYTE